MIKSIAIALIIFSMNLMSDVEYIEEVDAFSDEKTLYLYSETPETDPLYNPAYFKILVNSYEVQLIVFNAYHYNFANYSMPGQTYTIKVRFDKNPAFSVDAFVCEDFGLSSFRGVEVKDCKAASKSKRNPIEGLASADKDFIQSFSDQAALSEKLLVLIPGKQPLEFDLKGYKKAVQKYNDNFGSKKL
jgi:hypothetical protein